MDYLLLLLTALRNELSYDDDGGWLKEPALIYYLNTVYIHINGN